MREEGNRPKEAFQSEDGASRHLWPEADVHGILKTGQGLGKPKPQDENLFRSPIPTSWPLRPHRRKEKEYNLASCPCQRRQMEATTILQQPSRPKSEVLVSLAIY